MNKRFYIFLFIFFCGAGRLSAQQNLVPNPSFEIYDTCPDIPVINYYSGWVSDWYLPVPGGSSDYFNACDMSGNYTVPGNLLGYQNAKTGIAYSGIAPLALEYIQCALTSPMEAGKAYCISFYVSLVDSANYAIDVLGAFLSVGPIISTNLFFLSPQIANQNGNYLVSKDNWMQINGVYIATGGEDHITIGNFRDNNNTNLLLVSNDSNGYCYYYLDDVSILECLEPLTQNVFTPNSDGLNDQFSISAENLIEYKCSVYNRWGNEIANLTKQESFWDGRNKTGNPCESGVYYYLLIGKGYDEKEYVLKGFVQLLR